MTPFKSKLEKLAKLVKGGQDYCEPLLDMLVQYFGQKKEIFETCGIPEAEREGLVEEAKERKQARAEGRKKQTNKTPQKPTPQPASKAPQKPTTQPVSKAPQKPTTQPVSKAPKKQDSPDKKQSAFQTALQKLETLRKSGNVKELESFFVETLVRYGVSRPIINAAGIRDERLETFKEIADQKRQLNDLKKLVSIQGMKEEIENRVSALLIKYPDMEAEIFQSAKISSEKRKKQLRNRAISSVPEYGKLCDELGALVKTNLEIERIGERADLLFKLAPWRITLFILESAGVTELLRDKFLEKYQAQRMKPNELLLHEDLKALGFLKGVYSKERLERYVTELLKKYPGAEVEIFVAAEIPVESRANYFKETEKQPNNSSKRSQPQPAPPQPVKSQPAPSQFATPQPSATIPPKPVEFQDELTALRGWVRDGVAKEKIAARVAALLKRHPKDAWPKVLDAAGIPGERHERYLKELARWLKEKRQQREMKINFQKDLDALYDLKSSGTKDAVEMRVRELMTKYPGNVSEIMALMSADAKPYQRAFQPEREKTVPQTPDLPTERPSEKTTPQSIPEPVVSESTTYQSLGVSGLNGGKNAEGVALHPMCLVNPLNPYPKNWTVLIDETGSANDNRCEQLLRVVGVFVPDGANLPELRRHATDSSLAGTVDAVNTLRKLGCRCLGVGVDSLLNTGSDRWLYAIETILELALRLLPLNDRQNVKFNVLVEQRQAYNANQNLIIKYLCGNARERFARVYPKIGERIQIEGKFIDKEHPYNGYPDALAFLWGSPRMSDERQKSGLIGTCLIDKGTTGQDLRDAFDLIEREGNMDPKKWQVLLKLPDAGNKNSLVCALLDKLGQKISGSPTRWRDLLELTAQYADSRGVAPDLLQAQIEWLEKHKPAVQLSQKDELQILSSRFVLKRLRGEVVDWHSDEFNEFYMAAVKMRKEDSASACVAEIRLAEAFRSSRDYTFMRNLMARWIKSDFDYQIVGTKTCGRIKKFAGEIEAFLGNYERAIELFDEAEDALTQVSALDEKEEELEGLWISRDVAKMEYDPDSLGREIYLEARELRYSDPASSDYRRRNDARHYVVARYVATCSSRNANLAKESYLENPSRWKFAQRRPWDLIEFYRGTMLDDVAEQRKRYLNALRILDRPQSPVLKLLNAVYLAALLETDSERRTIWSDKYSQNVEDLLSQAPSIIDEDSKRLLRNQPTAPLPILEFARSLLVYLER